jgi:hypothetical protein
MAREYARAFPPREGKLPENFFSPARSIEAPREFPPSVNADDAADAAEEE